MENYYYFFIFLLCASIVIGAFSLQYYLNNNSYHNYVEKYYGNCIVIDDWASSCDNLTLDVTATAFIESDKRNMAYQPILLTIACSSILSIIMCYIIIYFYRHYSSKSKIYNSDINNNPES
jgi:hypothetical protein